jgi:hypothetical protein
MLPSAQPPPLIYVQPVPKQPKKGELVYKPTIFSYTCYGAYSVSLNDTRRVGTCNGIATPIEILVDMESTTREDAIRSFTEMTEWDMEGGINTQSLDHKTRNVAVSPALLFPEEPAPKNPNVLAEEALIKEQKWSCFGSTAIEYLVLKNETEGTEHVAAVAPSTGWFSHRSLKESDGSTINVRGLGLVSIVTSSIVDDSLNVQSTKTTDQQQSRNKTKGINTDGAISANVPEHTSGGEQASSKDSKKPSNKSDDYQIPPERLRPQLLQPVVTSENINKFVTQYSILAKKTAEHMKQNARLIVEQLCDEFPSRSYAAGKKIVGNIPKTLEACTWLPKKLYKSWKGEDDEDSWW